MRASISFPLLTLIVLLAACGPDETPTPPDDGERRVGDRPESEFLFDRDHFPAATEPKTVSPSEADWLLDTHEVFGVVVGEQARAYPITMLGYHHVVNDVIDGVPVLVTYCIVCSSGIAYDPVVGGKRLTFGVDGSWRGTATLYDRDTESLWLQVSGTCIDGARKGTVLAKLPTGRHTTWLDWRTTYPETDVMARDGALLRPGDRYFPHEGARGGSAHVPREMLSIFPEPDARLEQNQLVYGVVVGGKARAYPFRLLAKASVVNEVVDGTRVTIWFDEDSRSAAGFELGPSGDPPGFTAAGKGRIMDTESGSTWNMEGVCVAGKRKGSRLKPLHGLMSEWYGWLAVYPQTELWRP